MTDFIATLSGPHLTCLGLALIHFLWQGLCIGIVLEIALALAGMKNAALRHVLCGVALAVMPVCLAMTYGMLENAAILPTPTPTASSSQPASIANAKSTPPAESVPVVDDAFAYLAPGRAPSPGLNDWMPIVVAGWLIGVVILAARRAGGFIVLRRWRRRGVSAPTDATMELFRKSCARIGIDPRRACLKISTLVQVPMTMGWLRPIVLFPATLLTGLSTGEIELLLAHELAHIRRYDYLVNLLQAVVETLFFYHPVAWWISRRMRQERENACDDLVAAGSAEALAYAKVLLRLETLRVPGGSLAPAASGGSLLQRVQRLTGQFSPAPVMGAPGLVTLAGILLFIAVLPLLKAQAVSLPMSRAVATTAVLSMTQAQTPAILTAASAVTVSATKELVGDVGRLYHAMVYTQTSAAPPESPSWQFIADMANNAFPVTSGTVSLPPGSAWPANPVTVVQPDQLVGAHYLYVQGFKSESDLMAKFAKGQYAFNIKTGAPGVSTYTAPVSCTGTVPYPPIAPVITNTIWDAGALLLDPTSAVISFTNYPGATLTWEIVIPGKTYIMSAGGGGTSGGTLDLTGLLSYGQTYVAQLRFINRDKSSTVADLASPKDYAYSTMMAQIVEFTIKTPPEHVSVANPSAAPAQKISSVPTHAIPVAQPVPATPEAVFALPITMMETKVGTIDSRRYYQGKNLVLEQDLGASAGSVGQIVFYDSTPVVVETIGLQPTPSSTRTIEQNNLMINIQSIEADSVSPAKLRILNTSHEIITELFIDKAGRMRPITKAEHDADLARRKAVFKTPNEVKPSAPTTANQSGSPVLVGSVNQPSAPSTGSANPSYADSPYQQRYISSEMDRLTKRLSLTPDQESILRATMEAVVHHDATETVDQTLKEILSPAQEAIWEQVKTEARSEEARMYAMNEMNRIATMFPLSAAQKIQVLDAFARLRLNDQHRNFHTLAELTAQANAEESALAQILSPGQMVILEQQKAQLLETTGDLPFPASLTDESTWWPPRYKKPAAPMAPLPELTLQYNMPGR